MNKRRMATMILLLALPVMVMAACESATVTAPAEWFVYPTLTFSAAFTPSPLYDTNQDPAYAAAQATLAAGQGRISDLSYQSTVVSLNIDQAAKAAAQATKDFNQRQLMELSIQGTQISQDMARAAATQQFIAGQTQTVWDATAVAQSQAATATYDSYVLRVTQTAQVQALMDVQTTQSSQSNATLTAYSLTATPWAAIQADIESTRNKAARQAWWMEFVINPLRFFFVVLMVILLIAGGIFAYWRLMPLLELRLRTIARANDSSLLLVDGVIADAAPAPQYTQFENDTTPAVEISDPSDPAIVNWIIEAEQKLYPDEGTIL